MKVPNFKDTDPIVVVQPFFGQGGAECVAAWIIQSLANLAKPLVLTYENVSARVLNDRFGTNLKPGDFALKTVFPLARPYKGAQFTLLNLHWLMRICKKWPNNNVLFFSASSEMDFGRAGIQYVDFPSFAEDSVRCLGLFGSCKWHHRPNLLRKAYLRLGNRISGFSVEGVKANVTLAVSSWTAEIVQKVYGIKARTVYPPVTLQFPEIPFADREMGFVCVGRIVPSKRVLDIIKILKMVRDCGYDVHLHIIGPEGDPGYASKVYAVQKENRDWVFLEGQVSREALAHFIAKHRFGIHGMQYEHFGIAVAEMAKAGCIVFVPATGGQAEIVHNNQYLVYRNDVEAVEKIIAVLSDERWQKELSQTVKRYSATFTPENFMSKIQNAVKSIL